MPDCEYRLVFQLKSDAIFGSAERGDADIDIDIQHDRWGCPYFPGRTLKGVLREECAQILDNLEQCGKLGGWERTAIRLFGTPGSGVKDPVILRFDNAELPAALRMKLMKEVEDEKVSSWEVLEALTTTRSQTALDGWSGAAREKSLRKARVILRKTIFESKLTFYEGPEKNDKQLLAACLKAFQRCGTRRNRGTGELEAVQLLSCAGQDVLPDTFMDFKKEIAGGKP